MRKTMKKKPMKGAMPTQFSIKKKGSNQPPTPVLHSAPPMTKKKPAKKRRM